MGKTGKLLNLESLRGLAAVSVALYHFNIKSHFQTQFIDNAWLMVEFFFVLSGFVIALNYQDRISNLKGLLHFQLKRFFRIYPLHIVMLFVMLGIEIAKYLAGIYFNLESNNPAFSTNDLPSFIANLFLVHNFTMSTLTWNVPSWSISAEFYTYVLFGFAMILTGGKQKPVVLLSTVLIIISSTILVNISGGYSGPFRCLYSFFCGVIIFNIYDSFSRKTIFPNSFFAVLLLGVAIALVSTKIAHLEVWALALPLIFSAAILTLVMTDQQSTINKILGNKVLVYLGTISYGVYMINVSVWWVITQIARIIFKVPTAVDSSGRSSIDFQNAFFADFAIIIGISVTIILSHYSYKYIEQKFNNYRKKIIVT